MSVEIAIERAFPDHHQYTDADIERLAQTAHSAVARAFLTTEKDFVRLSESQRQRLTEIAPLDVAKLEVCMLDEDAVLRQLHQHLEAISSHPV
jgi:tetraacyldisaccharide 4'-kinase